MCANNYLIFSISDWIDQFWHFMKKAGNIQYLGTIFRVWQHCPIRSKNNKQIFDENLRIIWEKLSAWVTWLKNINKKSNFFMNCTTKWKAAFCNKIENQKLWIIVCTHQLEKFALHRKSLKVTRNPSLKCGDNLLRFKRAKLCLVFDINNFTNITK